MTTERYESEIVNGEEDNMNIMSVMPAMMGLMMVGMIMPMMFQTPQDGGVIITPTGEVHIRIKNPPSGAELWTATLADGVTGYPFNFLGYEYNQHIDISGELIFVIPEGAVFPLRVMALQIVKWNDAHTAYTVLYEIQSVRPYKYDFSIGGYGTEPDPSYRDVAIADYGTYYFNVMTEQFEIA